MKSGKQIAVYGYAIQPREHKSLGFFFLDLCALTASEESVSSFIVPQVRGDKDWFYKIKISFLQQNYNALQCNIFRYPM